MPKTAFRGLNLNLSEAIINEALKRLILYNFRVNIIAMKGKKSTEQDINFIGVTASVFTQYYNDNVPKTFPRATLPALLRFQAAYPGLFNGNSEWTINKHRKKLMDWLASHNGKI